VNTAWLCKTSELSPAGIPAAIPAKSSENFATPRARATAITHRQRVGGRPTKSTAGNAARLNRSAEKSSGGKWSRPMSMTTKLTPHTAATATASARSRGFIRSASPPRMVKHQRIVLHRGCSVPT
jgi:hypothetical protein